MTRLLFDENLSPRLVALLADHYPGSTHVSNCSTSVIASALRDRFADVLAFAADPAPALLVLSRLA